MFVTPSRTWPHNGYCPHCDPTPRCPCCGRPIRQRYYWGDTQWKDWKDWQNSMSDDITKALNRYDPDHQTHLGDSHSQSCQAE